MPSAEPSAERRAPSVETTLPPDPFLRRLEREAVLACLAMAGIGLIVAQSRLMAAASVLAGGALIGLAYRSVKGATDAALRGASGGLWRLVKFFTRYVILAVAAYVAVVRLRLHVAGVLAGASSFVPGGFHRSRPHRLGRTALRLSLSSRPRTGSAPVARNGGPATNGGASGASE